MLTRRVRGVLATLVFVSLSLTLVTGLPASAGAERHGEHEAVEATAIAGAGVTERRNRRLQFGAYVQGMQEDAAAFTDFEAMVDRPMAIASYFYGYGDVFPGPIELGFADGGRRKVLLSWDMGPTRFTSWTRGKHDRYLKTIARAARKYPYDVYVRPWPEMNGDWQTFQPTRTGRRPHGGTYREFIDAWRHVVTFTRKHGARNIKWVFNPTADTYPQTTRVEKIWPGARYVDVLGLDGYNWGRDDGYGTWKSFRSIFTKQYRRLTRLDRKAPVWICEFGSKEPLVHDGAPADPTHSKGEWLRGALRAGGLKKVRALVYFQADKERDWRVNSSAESLAAFKEALSGL
jgi:hypothetical protein